MTNLIFIDQNVPNSQLLIDALPPDSQYFLLDDKQDGIQQIADILQGWQNLDSIQIFSHGASGTLTLGSSVINNQNLKNYQQQLEQIGKSLSSNGDLLLYGCDVAQGNNGQVFINSLAQLTGADVAASNDLTGCGARG